MRERCIIILWDLDMIFPWQPYSEFCQLWGYCPTDEPSFLCKTNHLQALCKKCALHAHRV